MLFDLPMGAKTLGLAIGSSAENGSAARSLSSRFELPDERSFSTGPLADAFGVARSSDEVLAAPADTTELRLGRECDVLQTVALQGTYHQEPECSMEVGKCPRLVSPVKLNPHNQHLKAPAACSCCDMPEEATHEGRTGDTASSGEPSSCMCCSGMASLVRMAAGLFDEDARKASGL